MKKPALPAAARFIDEIRALYAREPDVATRWATIRERMKPFRFAPLTGALAWSSPRDPGRASRRR